MEIRAVDQQGSSGSGGIFAGFEIVEAWSVTKLIGLTHQRLIRCMNIQLPSVMTTTSIRLTSRSGRTCAAIGTVLSIVLTTSA